MGRRIADGATVTQPLRRSGQGLRRVAGGRTPHPRDRRASRPRRHCAPRRITRVGRAPQGTTLSADAAAPGQPRLVSSRPGDDHAAAAEYGAAEEHGLDRLLPRTRGAHINFARVRELARTSVRPLAPTTVRVLGPRSNIGPTSGEFAMNRRVGLAALLSIAMLGAYVHAQFGNQPAKLDTVKIKDDLFVIHNDYVPGNTTVLVTNEGVVLVDDKFEIDHENIMAQLK